MSKFQVNFDIQIGNRSTGPIGELQIIKQLEDFLTKPNYRLKCFLSQSTQFLLRVHGGTEPTKHRGNFA